MSTVEVNRVSLSVEGRGWRFAVCAEGGRARPAGRGGRALQKPPPFPSPILSVPTFEEVRGCPALTRNLNYSSEKYLRTTEGRNSHTLKLMREQHTHWTCGKHASSCHLPTGREPLVSWQAVVWRKRVCPCLRL